LAIIAGWYLAAELWALAARFSDILLLFLLAWVLSFVLKPVVRLLNSGAGIPRLAAVAMVYLGMVLVGAIGIIMLIPLVTLQLSQLGANLAIYGEQLPYWVAAAQAELLRREIYLDLAGFYRQQDLANQIERVGTLLIQNAIGILAGVASALFGMVLVLVLSFYIMADGGRLTRQVLAAVPPGAREELRFLFESIDRTFGGFIRGQLIQCTIYGVGTAIIMYLAGLNYVLVSSLFAGAIMLVPFLGPALAIMPPIMIAALQGSLPKVIIVTLALLALQQIVINVIAPKLLSETVGLPPLLVILAMLLGAKLAGVVGAIFGVPFAAVVYAMLLFLYRRSSLAGAAAVAQSEALWTSDQASAAHGTDPAPWLLGPSRWIGAQLSKVRGQQGTKAVD
jgi:predicted PurR-regulated permease PerM